MCVCFSFPFFKVSPIYNSTFNQKPMEISSIRSLFPKIY